MTHTTNKAGEALTFFKQITRNNGDTVWITENAPEWVNNLCHKAHGEMLPDDWRYQFIHQALCALSESEDWDDVELEADIYTNELTAWLHSRADRVYWLTEALTEFGPINDGFQALQTAQYLEKREVLEIVKEALNN